MGEEGRRLRLGDGSGFCRQRDVGLADDSSPGCTHSFGRSDSGVGCSLLFDAESGNGCTSPGWLARFPARSVIAGTFWIG
jgi:hypothetical protein